MSFCLYIAARVFVQYLKSRPEDSTVHSSLQFLVSALNAMKNKNPLTESFLVQLDVDLDGTGIRALDDRQKANMSAAHSMVVGFPGLFPNGRSKLISFSLANSMPRCCRLYSYLHHPPNTRDCEGGVSTIRYHSRWQSTTHACRFDDVPS